MKKLIIIPIFLLIIMSCSKSDNKDVLDYTNNHPELIGKWQFVQFLTDTTPNPEPITSGYFITFNLDGTFLSNQDLNYQYGNFNVSNSDEITLNYVSSVNYNSFSIIKEIGNINTSVMTLFRLNSEFSSGEKFEKVSNQ